MIDNYDRYLSRSGLRMQQSAIRRMGMVLARKRDTISFAPGYPASETSPGPSCRKSRASS